MTWRGRLERWSWVVPALAIAFPLLRLLPLDGNFAADWTNHKWLAAYAGEYLRAHHASPIVVNTRAYAGMPYPIFYGTLFYPLQSLFTAWLAPGMVLRLIVVGATWLEFRLVSTALQRLEVPRGIARALTCLVIWAIYPLTNLYNRAAVTEYVAVALLTGIVASWFLFLRAEQADRVRIAHGIGLMFAVIAGTHPITAVYAFPIFVLLLIAAYSERGRDAAFWHLLVRAFVVPIGCVAVVMAPWAYALAKYGGVLQVATDGGPFYYEDLDTLSSRFFPFPHDIRMHFTPIADVSTPFLDAQTNLALLLILIGTIVTLALRSRRLGLATLRATGLALVAFAFFMWISIDPTSFDYLPDFARILQLAYRAVTYQNLALLLAVFAVVSLQRKQADRPLYRSRALAALLVSCLLLAAVGVVIKWRHATRIMKSPDMTSILTTASQRQEWAKFPHDFYGYNAYATPPLFTALPESERDLSQQWIPIGDGEDDFGEPMPLNFTQATEGWVATNVEAFPWNQLWLDDRRVPPEELRVASIRQIVRVAPGAHKLELRTVADRVWLLLRTVSFAALALWILAFAYLSRRDRVRRAAGNSDAVVDVEDRLA